MISAQEVERIQKKVGATDHPRDFVTALRSFRIAPREAEVAWLLSWGRTDKQIAKFLGISVDTVQTYVKAVRWKLGVDDRADAGNLARVLAEKGRRGRRRADPDEPPAQSSTH